MDFHEKVLYAQRIIRESTDESLVRFVTAALTDMILLHWTVTEKGEKRQ